MTSENYRFQMHSIDFVKATHFNVRIFPYFVWTVYFLHGSERRFNRESRRQTFVYFIGSEVMLIREDPQLSLFDFIG